MGIEKYDDAVPHFNLFPHCVQGVSAPLCPVSLLRAHGPGRVCHVHLPRARPSRQPPSLHHREAGLCKLGSDIQHPFLPAGLESSAVTEKSHGNHGVSPIAEDVTLTGAFQRSQTASNGSLANPRFHVDGASFKIQTQMLVKARRNQSKS